MDDWQPDLYLRFYEERTQPSVDLVARIHHANPRRIIDIGCGPGNSTAELRERWRHAEIIGLDNSETMIARAQAEYADIEWLLRDAACDLGDLGKFDVVFSNATLQWIPDQAALVLKLFGLLEVGGVLAAQIPNTQDMPLRTELDRLAASTKWKTHMEELVLSHAVHPADFYYDALCKLTPAIELWETDYIHIMNSAGDIVQWYRSTGLRPYLDRLQDEQLESEFLLDYEAALTIAYPAQPDGKVLFPFTRVFFTATKA